MFFFPFSGQTWCEKTLTVPLGPQIRAAYTFDLGALTKSVQHKSHLFVLNRDLCLASLFALFAITKCYERGEKGHRKDETHRKCFHPNDLVAMNASKGLTVLNLMGVVKVKRMLLFVAMVEFLVFSRFVVHSHCRSMCEQN